VQPPVTSGSPPVVLLVEDDADVREEIADALTRGGYHVVEAAHGGDALEVLRRGGPRPQVILLDWMLPVMDGMTFLTQVASNPRYTGIPVVVLSAVAGMAKIPTLCVADVLAKPVRVRTLLDALARACQGSPGDGGAFASDPPTGERLLGEDAAPPAIRP
jgi:CheY-like chemotaxis protein